MNVSLSVHPSALLSKTGLCESIVCFAFHLVNFKIFLSTSLISASVFSSSRDCASALYFYHSKAFFLWLLSHVVDTAMRVPLISLAYFCMNQWYMTTVFLTIVFVGQGVHLIREMEEKKDLFWVGKGVCSTINNKRTRGKIDVWLSVYHWMFCQKCIHSKKKNLCGFMIGLSAIAENWQLDIDFLSVSLWPSCGFSHGRDLLAVSFALNHINHLIYTLFLISISSPIPFSSYPSPQPFSTSSLQLLFYYLHFSLFLLHFSYISFCRAAWRKVTPDHRLPLSTTAMLNNAANWSSV